MTNMTITREQEQALVQLGQLLRVAGYQFVTPTPATHAQFLANADRLCDPIEARDLRDIFGWSRTFAAGGLSPAMADVLQRAGGLQQEGDRCRSLWRFASLGDLLLAHSAYPTTAADSIFFGPDTYRFCAFLSQLSPVGDSVLDLGCGSGAGGLWLAHQRPLRELILTDINGRALAVARANARLAGLEARTVCSDLFSAVDVLPDLCVANPPYMKDAHGRAYRDGGGQHGEGLSIRMAREWLQRAKPGQVFALYTGSAIVAGQDAIRDQVHALCRASGAHMTHAELDPDVFGEELAQPGYERVERIAAIGIVIRR